MQQDRSPRLPRLPMGVRTNGAAAEILGREWRGMAHVQHGQKRVAIGAYIRFEHSSADATAELGYSPPP